MAAAGHFYSKADIFILLHVISHEFEGIFVHELVSGEGSLDNSLNWLIFVHWSLIILCSVFLIQFLTFLLESLHSSDLFNCYKFASFPVALSSAHGGPLQFLLH